MILPDTTDMTDMTDMTTLPMVGMVLGRGIHHSKVVSFFLVGMVMTA